MITTNIEFNFKGSNTSYLTHSLHPYPAKFPPQLPQSLLKQFAGVGQTVLDPFCGSGTTLLEARLQGINAIGVDVNGLSILLSKVKSTPLTQEKQIIIKQFITQLEKDNSGWKNIRPQITTKNIEGLSHWFQLNVAEELTYILQEITKIEDNEIKDFLKIVFSSIIVKVSNQDSDTRFAAVNKNILDDFTFKIFISKAVEYLKRVVELSNKIDTKTELTLFNADSRNLSFITDNSIDIIITSPPYANTYDYYLYHKFRKRWLDLDVKFAQYNEIGSRRQFSSLKHDSQKWTDDLILCFKEMHRVLKINHPAFIIIGDSVIKQKIIKIDEVIKEFVSNIGFEVKDIISSDLSNHSRIFNPTFAKKGKKEHLIILTKKND